MTRNSALNKKFRDDFFWLEERRQQLPGGQIMPNLRECWLFEYSKHLSFAGKQLADTHILLIHNTIHKRSR